MVSRPRGSFTPAEKNNVAKALLNKLRVDRIEIASARSPREKWMSDEDDLLGSR